MRQPPMSLIETLLPDELTTTHGYCDPQMVLAWMRKLSRDDETNVRRFVRGAYAWGQEFCKAQEGAGLSLSAVGSTIDFARTEPYEDIDFLLLTTCTTEEILLPNGAGVERLRQILYDNPLSQKVELVNESIKKAYLRHLPLEFRDRELLTITAPGRSNTAYRREECRHIPQEGHWSKIHMIVQGGVAEEREWDDNDRYRRVPIFRLPAE